MAREMIASARRLPGALRRPSAAPSRAARVRVTPGLQIPRAAALLAAVLSAILLAACGPGGEGGDPTPVGAADLEYGRRLRQGVEQLRLHLPASARAELEWCRERHPEDPELLFHQARLELMEDPGPDGAARASSLLERALEAAPGSVRAHRLLLRLDLAEASGPATDGRPADHRDAIIAAYGALGRAELEMMERFKPEELPELPEIAPEERDAGYKVAARASFQLRPRGGYAPGAAVDAMERLLRERPDLVYLRLGYVRRLLVGRVRLNETRDTTGLRMSSALTLDFAQSHLERIFDQVHPGSPVATEAVRWLGEVALRMGDFDQAMTWLELLLERQGPEPAGRARTLARMGFVRLRQERFQEADALIRRSAEAVPSSSPERLRALWLMELARVGARPERLGEGGIFPFREDLTRRDPASEPRFRDVASVLGVDKRDGLGPSAWGDVDGDGDLDLYVSGCDSYGALYRNDNGRFTDISREAGLFQTQSGFSATFADYDNDGDPDLYIGRDGWNGPAPNALHRNNGDGTFTDVTEAAGLGHTGSTFVHAWSDVDRDGDIDLFLANGITGAGDTNALMINNGDGTFTDGTRRAGMEESPGTRTIGAAFGDFNGDGWPDLFVSGYFTLNRLYLNRGDGSFREVAAESGVSGEDEISTGYVALVLDFDNDTRPDILRTSLAGWETVLEALTPVYARRPPEYRAQVGLHLAPRLYRNLGDARFQEVSLPSGLEVPMGIMGGAAGDLDNDGWLDLYFGTGDPEVDRMEPDRAFAGGAGGRFRDMTLAWGLGNLGKGHGVTLADVDDDGDLDIYAPEGGFVHGDPWPNALYENRLAGRNHWLQVDLVGRESNRDALDARLILTTPSGRQLRRVSNGEGFGSSSSPTVEFGLGAEAAVTSLEIRWPSGRVQRLENLAADRRILVVEGEAPRRAEVAPGSERNGGS